MLLSYVDIKLFGSVKAIAEPRLEVITSVQKTRYLACLTRPSYPPLEL